MAWHGAHIRDERNVITKLTKIEIVHQDSSGQEVGEGVGVRVTVLQDKLDTNCHEKMSITAMANSV